MDLINSSEADSLAHISEEELIQAIVSEAERLEYEQFHSTTVTSSLTSNSLLLNHSISKSDYLKDVFVEFEPDFPRVELGAAFNDDRGPSDCYIGLPNGVIHSKYVEENCAAICPTRNHCGSGVEETSTITAIRIQLKQQQDMFFALQKNILGLNGQEKQRYKTIVDYPKQLDTVTEFRRLNVPTIDQHLQLPLQINVGSVNQVPTSDHSEVMHSEMVETIMTNQNQLSSLKYSGRMELLREIETVHSSTGDIRRSEDDVSVDVELHGKSEVVWSEHPTPLHQEDSFNSSEDSLRMKQVRRVRIRKGNTKTCAKNSRKSPKSSKTYTCGECKRQFNNQSNLIVHLRIHSGVRPYQCKVCNSAFRQSSNLRVHQRIHSGERPYQCKECKYTFSLKENLTIHQRIHFGERPYQCKECNSAFRQCSNLRRHQRIHSGERPYQCHECNSAFSLKGNLTAHQRIHSGERPYHCKDCYSSFNQLNHLIRHQRTHSGEKPYKCRECNSAYSDASNLRRHKCVHSDERPFVCDICKKSFRLKGGLTSHMGIHSGKKSYKCNECKKKFTRESNLKQHLQIHSKKKSAQPFQHNTFST